MNPQLTRLALTPSSSEPETWVHFVSELLTHDECSALIKRHDDSLVPHDVTLTVRKRKVFDDEDLAETLWARLKPFFGDEKVTDEDGCAWSASHLNTRFRYCKYERGGAFEPHVDGRRLASVNEQSFMTVNIYLNTVRTELGGCTRVLGPCNLCTGTKGERHEHIVLGKVPPTEGLGAVFRDSLHHDGEELRGGVKYLLRTDVMFSRDDLFDLDSMCKGMTTEEKGKKALGLAVKLEDGNNFDDAILWYKKAYKLYPALEIGEG